MKKELTKTERRLAILKDALAQVKAGLYKTQPGTVCTIADSESRLTDGDLQAQLSNEFLKKNRCSVCQRGSLLLSTIRKENSFSRDDYRCITSSFFDPDTIVDRRLLKVFAAPQISLMEAAFEVEYSNEVSEEDILEYQHDFISGKDPISKKERLKAIIFGRKYKKHNERQIAILKNAIKNNGVFKP